MSSQAVIPTVPVRIRSPVWNRYLISDHTYQASNESVTVDMLYFVPWSEGQPIPKSQLWVFQQQIVGYALINVYTDRYLTSLRNPVSESQSTLRIDLGLQTGQVERDALGFWTLQFSPDATTVKFLNVGVNGVLDISKSKADLDPRIFGLAPSAVSTDGQQFQFVYGDLVFSHIEYHVDRATLSKVFPIEFGRQTAANVDETAESKSVTIAQPVTEEYIWSLESNTIITDTSASITAQVGIPDVQDGKVIVGSKVVGSFTYGHVQTNTYTIERTATGTVNPGRWFWASVSCKEVSVTVPFDAWYTSPEFGSQQRVPGSFVGGIYYDVSMETGS